MRTALIHYWLVADRGGEKVLGELGALYPEARVFTHVYDPTALPESITRLDVQQTFISRLPAARERYQSYLPLMPLALNRLDLSGFDLIISSESGPAKGIRKPPGATHVCYCHTPMRYIWDMADEYYASASLVQKVGMKLLLPALRRWDLWSATQVDHFIANSRFVAERIERIYGRQATVIHPPVDTEHFLGLTRDPGDYYLYFGQLTAYKRAELAVRAFNELGTRLLIAGTGEERETLEEIAAPNVQFLGRVSDGERDALYSGARALIFPGVEDFGIVPVEAQAAGCPVIALGKGGALETVVDQSTGLFFHAASVEALVDAVRRFESAPMAADDCREQARGFSAIRFRRSVAGFLDELT